MRRGRKARLGNRRATGRKNQNPRGPEGADRVGVLEGKSAGRNPGIQGGWGGCSGSRTTGRFRPTDDVVIGVQPGGERSETR